MFRKMRRFKQQLSDEQCVEVLKGEHRGVLSVLGDDGYPYGVPLDHWYCEEDGHLYFHGAREGHKVDAIRSCDKASYCVFEQGVPNEKKRGLDVRCVIAFGRVRLVDDPDVIAPLKFLREREVVHFQRFGDALRVVQDNLDCRNFYAMNPEFDK